MDTQGFYCGIDNSKVYNIHAPRMLVKPNFVHYPYLFYDGHNTSSKICVSKCPTRGNLKRLKYANKLDNRTYNAKYYPNTRNIYEYKTKTFFNRCIPDVNIEELIIFFLQRIDSLKKFFPRSDFFYVVFDLKWPILVSLAGCFIGSLVSIMSLRYIAKFIVYLGAISLPFVLIIYSVSGFNIYLIEHLNPTPASKDEDLEPLTLIIFHFILEIILIFIIIKTWSKFNDIISIIKLASRAFFQFFMIIIIHIISMILPLIFALAFKFLIEYLDSDDETSKDIGKIIFESINELSSNDLGKTLLTFFSVMLLYHLAYSLYYASSIPFIKWYFTGQERKTCCGYTGFYGYWLAWTKGLGIITISDLVMLPFMKIMFLRKLMLFIIHSLFIIHQIFNTSWKKSAKLFFNIVVRDTLFLILAHWLFFVVIYSIQKCVTIIITLAFNTYISDVKKNVFAKFIESLFSLMSNDFLDFMYGIFAIVLDTILICYLSEKVILGSKVGDASNLANHTNIDIHGSQENDNTTNENRTEKMEKELR